MKPWLFLAFAALLACASHAQFPERPVTRGVPFAAGGATDTLARQFAEHTRREGALWKKVIRDAGIPAH